MSKKPPPSAPKTTPKPAPEKAPPPAPEPPPDTKDDRRARFIGGPESVQVKGGTVTLL